MIKFILKLFITEVRRVDYGITEAPWVGYMAWKSIEVKLFGLWWVELHGYIVALDYK